MNDMRSTLQKSIIDMSNGAFKERIDYEMGKALDNILDPNTRADKKRTVTITIDLLPDAERRQIATSVTVKSKLEPTSPVGTALYITGSKDGKVTAVEMVPQIPGQQDLAGGEQEEPATLRLIKGA